jgi:hypothetical protein
MLIKITYAVLLRTANYKTDYLSIRLARKEKRINSWATTIKRLGETRNFSKRRFMRLVWQRANRKMWSVVRDTDTSHGAHVTSAARLRDWFRQVQPYCITRSQHHLMLIPVWQTFYVTTPSDADIRLTDILCQITIWCWYPFDRHYVTTPSDADTRLTDILCQITIWCWYPFDRHYVTSPSDADTSLIDIMSHHHLLLILV